MKKQVLILGTCLITGFLSGCTFTEATYLGVTPAVSPSYVSFGLGFGSTGFYGENPYWGVGINNWYSPGVYYGPSIYSYDW